MARAKKSYDYVAVTTEMVQGWIAEAIDPQNLDTHSYLLGIVATTVLNYRNPQNLRVLQYGKGEQWYSIYKWEDGEGTRWSTTIVHGEKPANAIRSAMAPDRIGEE